MRSALTAALEPGLAPQGVAALGASAPDQAAQWAFSACRPLWCACTQLCLALSTSPVRLQIFILYLKELPNLATSVCFKLSQQSGSSPQEGSGLDGARAPSEGSEWLACFTTMSSQSAYPC